MPASLVVTFTTAPCSVLFNTTSAAGIPEREESVTRPEMVALSVCVRQAGINPQTIAIVKKRPLLSTLLARLARIMRPMQLWNGSLVRGISGMTEHGDYGLSGCG